MAASAAGGKLSPGVVIVLDEAGAVGLDDMVKLFELARRDDCRVILSGDTGQHSSVPRGDALRIIEQYSSYRFGELTTIRRQKPEAFRQVVELAAAKQTDKAFAKLVELGAVSEIANDDGQLYQRAADAYVSATKQGKSALLVSPTWAEIDAVTEKVRETLKADGVISQRMRAVIASLIRFHGRLPKRKAPANLNPANVCVSSGIPENLSVVKRWKWSPRWKPACVFVVLTARKWISSPPAPPRPLTWASPAN